MFFGHYSSATATLTGCVQEFVTTAQSQMIFPPQIIRYCTLCRKDHAFRFVQGRTASTPKQLAQLDAYCTTRSIEQGVNIDTK